MPKKKKPVLATEDDLVIIRETIATETQRSIDESAAALQACEQRLKSACLALQTGLAAVPGQIQTTDAAARLAATTYTDECAQRCEDGREARCVALDQTLSATERKLTNKIERLEESMRQLLAGEMTALCERFDSELSSLKVQFADSLEQWATEAAQSLVEQRKQIDVELANLHNMHESHKSDALDRYVHGTEFERVRAEQKVKDEKQDERNAIQQAEIYVDIGLLKEALQKAEDQAALDTQNMAGKAAHALGILNDHAKERLKNLDVETGRLADSMSIVESFTTKRVEWVIQNASKTLRVDWGASGQKLHTGWFSPKFDAAGCFGLQLELQLFRITEHEMAGQRELGNVAAFLWSCKGTSIVFKIYIGQKSMVLEKTFNGRVPYGTPRLCWLHDQINKEDDTLRVGVEILESVREVEHKMVPPPLPPRPLEGDEEAARVAVEAAKHAVEGSLFFKRHITNRLLDQVHREVELMRSRMVRKIEWRVQHGSLLRQCFPKGEPICSPQFGAAGVEQLQFVLYPSGYVSATDGFCSVFIYGPVGATLKCNLSIGKQTRQICHTFDDSGAFGRTNFCNWANTIDEDDAVMIRLEIDEAAQDTRAATVHAKVVEGDRRTLGQIDGTDVPPIESVVKLTRTPGTRAAAPGSISAPGLEDAMVLPSLWTAKRLGDGGEPPDGFRHFHELLGQKPYRSSLGAAPQGTDLAMRPTSAVRLRPTSAAANGMKRQASLPDARPRSGVRRPV